ncbi:19343_t:CDS:2, partial [Racocetra persica]
IGVKKDEYKILELKKVNIKYSNGIGVEKELELKKMNIRHSNGIGIEKGENKNFN